MSCADLLITSGHCGSVCFLSIQAGFYFTETKNNDASGRSSQLKSKMSNKMLSQLDKVLNSSGEFGCDIVLQHMSYRPPTYPPN